MSRHILDRKGERLRPWKIVSACGLSLLLLFGQTAPVMGNPTGGDVVAGNANIGSAGATLTINQTSNNAIINWQQFSIANGELTKFLVPGSTSATLNRVLGGNPSAIYGTLQSNGVLYLVNPSGIVVGPNGRIDTAGFIGSTLDISNDQFLKGDLHFVGNSDASIDNAGIIHSSTGDVYLIANQVNNTGTLIAPHGTVGMAAGSDVLFQQAGSQHLFIKSTPTGATRATGVTNSGSIQAAAAELKAAGGNAYALAINNTGVIAATGYKKVNGQVYLTADGGNITNSGTITAKTKSGNGGTIVLNGHGTTSSGTVLNTGTLDASGKAAGKVGGTVQVLGNRVGIADHGVVDVSGDAGGGTALIGGDEHGANPAIANADQTYLGPDATIKADALTLGTGGKVILWSNLSTQAYGSISVRGGAQGGDGGFVETSGLHLDLQMAPQIGAPHGKGGTWLLDPTDVTITDGGSDSGISPFGSNPIMFFFFNDNATITQATLLSELQSGNVLIDASSGGSGNAAVGTITWSQPNLQPFDIGQIPSGNTLTLNAAGQIYLNGITIKKVNASDTGSLNLVLNDQSYTQGNVLVLNSTIKLNGGNFTANGIGFASTTASTSLGGSDGVDIYSSTIDAEGGNITLNGQAGYFQNTFFGPTNISAGTGVIINVSLLQTKGTGNITITGDGSIPTVDTNSNPISSATSLTGVSIGNQVFGGGSAAGSLITVEDGAISITGKVNTGDLGDTAGGGQIHGLEILTNSVITTTGVAGTSSITLVGNTSGSSNELGDNIGVYINGTDFNTTTPTPHTAIIQVGTGSGGISITGTGGDVTTVSSQNSTADGVNLTEGVSITATGSAPISITGYGGTNTNTDSSNTGSANGVDMSTDQYGSNYISSDSGDITITGTGGVSASAGMGVLIAGTQATNSTPVVTTKIETQSTGSIYVTGYGDTSYTGSGFIVGQYVPNYGVAIADYATLHTDISGAALNVGNNEGLISINGIGSSNSYGVGIEQLPPGTFDLFPVQPTITAGGELKVTAYQSGHPQYTGIYINNADINAAIATFGTGTTNNFTGLTSGPVDIENSSITLGGGDFTAYGRGNDLNLNGITINGTTIDTQGGQYFLTGAAAAGIYDKSVTALDGSTVAGEGVLIEFSNLQAENLAGISIFGDASLGTTVANALVGVDIPESFLTVQNGRILIQGTVNNGTAEDTTLAESAGFNGYGVRGVNIGDSSASVGATIQATGTSGSVTILGNTTGSTSDAFDSSHDNVGVSIQNNATKITSAGNGVAFIGSSTTYHGIYIEGDSGDLINNQFDSVANSSSGTVGVQIHKGASVMGTNTSDITLIGQSGTNSMLNTGDTVGSAAGVAILADGSNGAHANGNTVVSNASGNILIKGTGNTSPSKGIGVALLGVEGSSASVTSSTGNITMSGLAGGGNTGGGGSDFLPNFGLVIADKSVVQTGGTGTINLSGVGAGANNAAVEIVRLPTTFDSMSVAPQITTATTGAFNITTTGGLVGTDIVLDGASVNAGTATFTSAGEVLMAGSTLTLNGNFTASGTATTNDAFVNYFGDLGGPFIPNGDGVYMAVSSISSQGGNINLTGQASYQLRNFGASGTGNVAGVGVVLTSATLQTIGTGGITIIGHGGVGNVQIADDMNGVYISNFQFFSTVKGPSSLSVVNGALSITGDVDSGTSLEAPPFNTFADGTGPNGVNILGASTISATGASGSVSIVGDTTGSNSDATDTTNNNHDNTGVRITGTGTKVSSAGSGGISIQGFAGDILNNQVGGTGSTAGAAAADGIKISGGATIQSTGTGNITMTGVGGTNNTLGGAVLGSAEGVSITSNGANSSPNNGNTLIDAASGNVSITGTGGTSPNEGTGIVVAGRNGAHTTIDPVAFVSSAPPTGITLNGTGGSGNTGPGSTTYPGVIYGHNAGILIVGDARLQNTGTSGITLIGAGGGTTKYGVLVNPFPAGTSTTSTAPTIQAGSGPLNVTANVGKILFTSTGTSTNPISAGSATFIAADTLDTSTSFFSVPGVFTATTIAGDLTLGSTTVGQLILNSGANLILGTENATSAIALDAYKNGTITQTGPLTTSLLSILGGNGIILDDPGNSIPFLGTVTLTGPQTFNFLTNQALSLVGLVSGDGLMNIVTTGGDLTIASTGQVTDSGTGANVVLAAGLNLAGSHYFINNSSMGANAVQVSSGATYSIYSSDPTSTQLGGIVPDVTLYGVNFIPASGAVTSNGALYYAAQGAQGPNAPNSGLDTGGGSNVVPPVLTPQPVFPTVPPIDNNGGPNPPPFSFTGDGTSGQTGTTTGGLADSSGNSGQIGTGDAAQLNGGQLNNVTDPAAAGTLNEALGPAVHNALADALKTIGDYNDETAGTGAASAGNGETILTGGDFGEIGGSDVQKIPASQAPPQLQNALGNGVLNNLPSGGGAGAGTGH